MIDLFKSKIFVSTILIFSICVLGCKGEEDYCNEDRSLRYEQEAKENDIAEFHMCGNLVRFEKGTTVKIRLDEIGDFNQPDEYLYKWQDAYLNAITQLKAEMQKHEINILNVSSNEDILVRLVDKISDDMVGYFHFDIYTFNGKTVVNGISIKVDVNPPSNDLVFYEYERIRGTILHELTHSMGIYGHSMATGDVMSLPHGSADYTDRDLRTLDYVYSKEVDIPIRL